MGTSKITKCSCSRLHLDIVRNLRRMKGQSLDHVDVSAWRRLREPRSTLTKVLCILAAIKRCNCSRSVSIIFKSSRRLISFCAIRISRSARSRSFAASSALEGFDSEGVSLLSGVSCLGSRALVLPFMASLLLAPSFSASGKTGSLASGTLQGFPSSSLTSSPIV